MYESGGHGTSGSIEGFPLRTPGEGSIEGDAQALSATAGTPQSVARAVAGKHSEAVAGVSGMIEQAMSGADASAKAAAVKISRMAISGGSALGRFATAVGEHNDTVNTLNAKIFAETDPEKQRKKKARLSGQYHASLEQLEQVGGKVGGWLDRPLAAGTIRAMFRAGAMPGATPAIFPKVGIDGKDQYKAIKNKLRNGDLPPLKDLPEAQRRQLLRDNPDVLPWLMKQDDPTRQEKRDVLDLAVPHLDGSDGTRSGQDVLDALERKKSPADFAKALGLVGEFGAYAKWAQQHDGPRLRDGQVGFLKNFYGKTGDKVSEIQDYIKAEKHQVFDGTSTAYNPYGGPHEIDTYRSLDGFGKDQQAEGLKDFANGLLALSDRDLGGGWNDLPEPVQDAVRQMPSHEFAGGNQVGVEWNEDFEEMAGLLKHGDAAPGDGLAKELGNTAAKTLGWYDAPFGKEDDSAAGDALAVLSRNHEAVTDIFAGKDLPEGMDSRDFVHSVYTHDWNDDSGSEGDDGGRSAAALTDWMSAPDPGEEKLADSAYRHLVNAATVTENGHYKDVIDGVRDNPAIAVSLGKATSGHLEEMSLAGPEPTSSSRDFTSGEAMRMTMLVSTDDRAAQGLAAVAQDVSNDAQRHWLDDPDSIKEYASRSARVQALVENGIYNESLQQEVDVEDAKQHVKDIKDLGFSLAGSAVPGAGPASAVFSSAVDDALDDPAKREQFHPSDRFGIGWDESGSHREILTGANLIDALQKSGRIPKDEIDLLQLKHDPDVQPEDRLRFEGKVDSVLKRHGIDPEPFNRVQNDRVGELRDTWRAGKDSIDEIVEHGQTPGG